MQQCDHVYHYDEFFAELKAVSKKSWHALEDCPEHGFWSISRVQNRWSKAPRSGLQGCTAPFDIVSRLCFSSPFLDADLISSPALLNRKLKRSNLCALLFDPRSHLILNVPRQSCYQVETSRISKPTMTTREERRETYKENTARKNVWGEYWNSLKKRQDRIKSRIRARIMEITKKLLIFGTKFCRSLRPLFLVEEPSL